MKHSNSAPNLHNESGSKPATRPVSEPVNDNTVTEIRGSDRVHGYDNGVMNGGGSRTDDLIEVEAE